jgi:hypothetical protein
MDNDLTKLEIKQKKREERPVLLVELLCYVAISILLLGIIYSVSLNTIFNAQQSQIEKHVTSFLDGDASKQEISVKFLFFKKSISLSKEGGIATVDLGSDADFNKHCIETNFKIAAEKERGLKGSFEGIKSRCDEYADGSVFSVEWTPPLPRKE